MIWRSFKDKDILFGWHMSLTTENLFGGRWFVWTDSIVRPVVLPPMRVRGVALPFLVVAYTSRLPSDLCEPRRARYRG